MKLFRKHFNKFGVFGVLVNDDNSEVYMTLEHAYPQPDGNFISKIPDGEYLCIRGKHQLDGMTYPFETFEITGVEGHSNILFHSGNVNADSAGCVLLGLSAIDTEILHSRDAFVKFMKSMIGVDSFTLTVS